MFIKHLEKKIQKINELRNLNGTTVDLDKHFEASVNAVHAGVVSKPIKRTLKNNLFNGIFDGYISKNYDNIKDCDLENQEHHVTMKNYLNNKEHVYKIVKHNDRTEHEAIPIATITKKGIRPITRDEFLLSTQDPYNEKNALKLKGIEVDM